MDWPEAIARGAMKEKSWRKPFPRFFSGKMANERVLARPLNLAARLNGVISSEVTCVRALQARAASQERGVSSELGGEADCYKFLHL